MMKRIPAKLKKILLIGMSVALAAVIALSVYEVYLYRTRMITYETENEYRIYSENMASIFSAEYIDNLNSGVSEPAEEAVYNILGSYPGSYEMFNALVSEEKVYFYKNNEETVDYSKYNRKELFDLMTKAGGENINELAMLAGSGSSGCVRMSIDNSGEWYYVYYHGFEVDGKSYGMMHLVLESYYLNNAMLNKHSINMLILIGIMGIAMIAAILFMAYLIRKYNKLHKQKEDEVVKYQANISELNNRIYDSENINKPNETVEELTGVYSQRSMTSFIVDADSKRLPACVAVIGASYTSSHNRLVWSDFVDYLKKNLNKNYKIGMVDDKHMIILGVNIYYERFEKDVYEVLKNSAEKFKYYEFSPAYVFERNREEKDTVSRVVRDAVYAFDNN